MNQTNLFHENLDVQSVAIYNKQRREDRLPVNTSVEITGIDPAGQPFTEKTTVEDVTEIGCRFSTRTQLQCGDIVAIKALEPGERALADTQSQLFEVVWAAHHRTGCTVGARKLQGEKLAKTKFPPPDYSPRRPAK